METCYKGTVQKAVGPLYEDSHLPPVLFGVHVNMQESTLERNPFRKMYIKALVVLTNSSAVLRWSMPNPSWKIGTWRVANPCRQHTRYKAHENQKKYPQIPKPLRKSRPRLTPLKRVPSGWVGRGLVWGFFEGPRLNVWLLLVFYFCFKLWWLDLLLFVTLG